MIRKRHKAVKNAIFVPIEYNPDPKQSALLSFQALEWHILILACSEFSEDLKKILIDTLQLQLRYAGRKLQGVSKNWFGISPRNVEIRVKMTNLLTHEILRLEKRYTLSASDIDWLCDSHKTLNNFEVCEWQMLEQNINTKGVKKNQDMDHYRKEQDKLLISAEKYYEAANNLADQSVKLGIPKEIVLERATFHLKFIEYFDVEIKNSLSNLLVNSYADEHNKYQTPDCLVEW